ncbi:MAG: hypothetical protein KAH96_00060 [Alphaproteobacteria bacterium]|nr:hypothetical protein [Alphaproteobacteria bacterium]
MPASRGHPEGCPAVIMTHKTRGRATRPPRKAGVTGCFDFEECPFNLKLL